MAVVVALVVAVVAVVVVNRGEGDEETQSSAHRFRGGLVVSLPWRGTRTLTVGASSSTTP